MERRNTCMAAVALLVASVGVEAQAGGPLRVLSSNPRYFTDDSGQAIYLTGSHVWNNFQDWGTTDPPSPLNYTVFLDFIQGYGHNFFRGWAWEQAKWVCWSTSPAYIDPLPYQRTGPGTARDGKPKFDVTKFNQAYFDRLRARVVEAGDRGIYVGVMLFEGWSIEKKGKSGNPWSAHPYHASNNINGINGDPDGDGEGKEVHMLQVAAVRTLQESYAAKVVDTLNDLDNIIWEISNESNGRSTSWDSTGWQHHMITYIRNYETGKPKQHPVWMTGQYPSGSNTDLYNSSAHAVSLLGSTYKDNPAAADGSKVSILDTDHLWGIGGNRAWVWKSFTRGHNPIFMDPIYGILYQSHNPNDPNYIATRIAMGHTRQYALKMDLKKMMPRDSLASTTYCLTDTFLEYLVYQPGSGAFTVDLSATPATFSVEWFNPATGAIANGDAVAGGGTRTLTPPFSGDAVVYLKASDDTIPPSVPSNAQATGQSSGSVGVTWTASTDNVGVTGYKVYRNGGQVGTSTTTTYIDTGLTANTTYSYAVSAYDGAGNNSAQSSPPATATTLPPDTQPPSVPAGVAAAAQSSNSIQVTWTASTDNVGVTGYQVYRNGGPVGTSTTTSFADGGLSPDTTYSYTVSAYDGAGNNSAVSSPPATAKTHPGASGPSQHVTVISMSGDSYTNAAARDTNYNAQGLRLYRGSTSGTSIETFFWHTTGSNTADWAKVLIYNAKSNGTAATNYWYVTNPCTFAESTVTSNNICTSLQGCSTGCAWTTLTTIPIYANSARWYEHDVTTQYNNWTDSTMMYAINVPNNAGDVALLEDHENTLGTGNTPRVVVCTKTANPTATATPSGICPGDCSILASATGSGDVLKWYSGGSCGGSSIGSGQNFSVCPTSTTTYSCRWEASDQSYGACVSNCSSVTVTVVPDTDADGVCDTNDNCPNTPNPPQTDGDNDGKGDACDNCPGVANSGQENADGDSKGDACDGCPSDPNKIVPGVCGCGVADTDTDTDGVPDCVDQCPGTPEGKPINEYGCPTIQADFDFDGDVDGADYGVFASCFNGSGNPINPGCSGADLNGDNAVDGIDYGLFASCHNGTGNPPACQ